MLDHLQLSNRPGLKFPSRDFARASKTLTSALLSPKASMPKPKAPSPSPASPIAQPVRAPAAVTEAEAPTETLPQAAPEAAAEAAPEVSSEREPSPVPEPKRPVCSRFTEEYLTPIVHSTRAKPARALSDKQPDQASPAAGQPPSTVDTQTSNIAEYTDADPYSLYGFKRHTSLREPLMGIEQVYAHPRLGRPTADDVIATAGPHMTQPQRRATTDFMLDAAEEAEPAPAAAAADDGSNEVYESDFVEDLVRSLSTGAARDQQDPSEAAVMLDLDAEMAGLLGPEEEDPASDVMLDLDDEMDGLRSSAEVHGPDPQHGSVSQQGTGPQHGSDPLPSEDSHYSEGSQPTQVMAEVHDVSQRATIDVEEQVTSDAAVSEALASAQSEAVDHFEAQTLAVVDEALGGLVGDTLGAADVQQAAAIGETLYTYPRSPTCTPSFAPHPAPISS